MLGRCGSKAFWLFPAHAGVIPVYRQKIATRYSFPRTCGGDPHERLQQSILAALFPAHAGVILCICFFPVNFVPFPRTCGGDPNEAHFNQVPNLFSPHMRGWSEATHRGRSRRFLFPAYAGVIPAQCPWASPTGPFPRMCGVCEKESRAVPLRMLFCRLQILCGPAL